MLNLYDKTIVFEIMLQDCRGIVYFENNLNL